MNSGKAALETERQSWFSPLAEEVGPSAYRFAVWLSRDPAIAQDFVQEALMKLWKSERTPRGVDDFRRVFYRSISNLGRDHARRERVRSALRLAPLPVPDAMAEVDRRLGDRELAAAVARLSRKERELIYLRFVEQRAHAEIGALIGKNEGAVRVSLHRTLGHLRRNLAPVGVLPEAPA